MKFICIGRNYVDHIEELNNPRPDEPIIFLKPDSALLIKDQPFFIPEFSQDIPHEVEILVKINKIGKHIDRKFAHKYYDEIGLGIDFTARDLQKKLKDQGLPWERAKSFDGAAVVGNWLPKEQFENIDDIGFSLTKNGDVVQQGNTSLMLWKIDEIIEFVSKYFTLKIGDVIFTGTPKGVSKVVANDTLEGYVGKTQLLSIKIK